MSGGRAAGLAAKLLALGISALVGLGIAELGVRLLRPQSLSVWAMTDDGLVIHRRGIRSHVTAHGKRFETNAIGMRDRDHPRRKPDGHYRILLFGDSFMEAAQVEFEDSLPHQLERDLSERLDRPVDVVNLAVSGWGTDAQLAYFERHASDYEPDLVLIAMTLHNDVRDNLAEQYHDLESGRLEARPVATLPLRQALRQRVQEWLAGHSHLYQLFVGSLRARGVVEQGRVLDHHVVALLDPDPSPRIERGWALTEALLDRFQERASEQGARMGVLLIPLVYGVIDARLQEFLDEHGLEASRVDVDRPQRVVREWGERRGVPVFDLRPALRDWAVRERSNPYLTLDGHWNEDGHRVGAAEVARRLAEGPIDAGRRPPPPRSVQ